MKRDEGHTEMESVKGRREGRSVPKERDDDGKRQEALPLCTYTKPR